MPVADPTPVKSGTEFVVSTTTNDNQYYSDIAAFADGSYVIVWGSNVGFGNLPVMGQRFNADGTKLGSEFTITGDGGFPTAGAYPDASVAALTGGGFVVTWTDNGTKNYASVYAADGSVVVAKQDLGDAPVYAWTGVTAASDGGYYVTYARETTVESNGPGGFPQSETTYQICVRHCDADGSLIGKEIIVKENAGRYSEQMTKPAITELASGKFVVTWQESRADGSDFGIFGRVYSKAGVALGTVFQVNTYTDKAQTDAQVEALADGGFVVVWQSTGQDGSSLGVYGQRYDASGEQVGEEFQVHTKTEADQFRPSVLALPDGGYLVTYITYGQDGDGQSISAQRFDADGAKIGSEFVVNTTAKGAQFDPSIALTSDTSFVITWATNSAATGGDDIVAQEFTFTDYVKAIDPPTVSVVAGDDVVNAAEKAAGVTISGTAPEGTLEVKVRLGVVVKTVTVTDGKWSVEFATAELPPTDGARDVTVTGLGGGGVESEAVVHPITMDTKSPPSPFIAKVEGDDKISAPELADGVVVSGKAFGDAVKAIIQLPSGTQVEVTIGADGTYSQTIPPGVIPADGSYTVKVRVEDAAGNLGEWVEKTITIDRTDRVNPVTLSDEADKFAGTQWDDLVNAQGENDTIKGGDGNDTLNGSDGRDALSGDAGNDSLYGGTKNDTLNGGDGNDQAYGGSGDDKLFGGAGADNLDGGAGKDSMEGGNDSDSLYGGGLADTMLGGAGDDFLFGGTANDQMKGDAGADRLEGGGGFDVITGGADADLFVFGKGSNGDTITDFDIAEGDRIQLKDTLWTGNLTADQVVAKFAKVTVGGDVVFTFATGDKLTLDGLTSVTGLAGQIDIV